MVTGGLTEIFKKFKNHLNCNYINMVNKPLKKQRLFFN